MLTNQSNNLLVIPAVRLTICRPCLTLYCRPSLANRANPLQHLGPPGLRNDSLKAQRNFSSNVSVGLTCFGHRHFVHASFTAPVHLMIITTHCTPTLALPMQSIRLHPTSFPDLLALISSTSYKVGSRPADLLRDATASSKLQNLPQWRQNLNSTRVRANFEQIVDLKSEASHWQPSIRLYPHLLCQRMPSLGSPKDLRSD